MARRLLTCLACVVAAAAALLLMGGLRAQSASMAAHEDPSRLGSMLRQLLDQAPQSDVSEGLLISSVQSAGLTPVAFRPRKLQFARPVLSRRQKLYSLPIIGFIALLIGGAIISAVRSRSSALGALRSAVQRREFVVRYQPIIELQTGRCVGAEALVRWRRYDGSIVPPEEFISLAEASGLIIPITDQVIDLLVAELHDVLVADRNLHISMNLSAQDIQTGRGLDYMQTQIGRAGIRSDQIWFEMTESGSVEIDAARATMMRMRDLGHLVSIDDFGTGYASLHHLHSLPLDALKIDKSFIDMIGHDTAGSKVMPYILDIAAALQLFCVAEGVQTQEQVDYLVERNVAFGQGWLFSKPLTSEGFVAFYKERKARYGPYSRTAIPGWPERKRV
ncbi:EAL domain-containing protein [Candidimonas nitroreducens]|uniref:EAL domain-containing protein n=1 Tax=Candidimonas nitroreducens TaxID=683354 RepID=UPI001302F3A4|nr:EAL domain-containing protein [Candidimonas nitroreducens]